MSPSAKVRSKCSSYLQPQLTLHAACFFHLDSALSLTFHACTISDGMKGLVNVRCKHTASRCIWTVPFH